MSLSPTPRQLFAREVARPESEMDMARAALLVAREEYPQISVELYLARLDQMAEEVKDRLADETAPLVVLSELLDMVYRRRGFKGNRKAYYDPRNSFLNDVLDRGLGIPLTLGMVVLEVGWRLGLPLEGVNFPSHFLVRYRGDAIRLLIDPFDGGRMRFEDQAQELLDQVYGGMVRVQKHFLRPASRRDMLVRLLTNLKGVYVNVGDNVRALASVERILLIQPTSRGENRARGLLLARLGRRDEAVEQLQAYLDLA
ncbi:MAG: transglutaminase-like domain-containing protein, partial [Gemmatimonadota bacterium]